MKITFLKYLAAFLITSSLLSLRVEASSNEWGNGGHGVRCTGSESEELLDFYEAKANGW